MITLKHSRILLPVMGLLAISGGGLIAANAESPVPQLPPTGTPPRAGKGHERHPELMKALKSLEKAKSDLQKSARDFDGHRAKAEELTEQAIKEVNEAMKSDKN